jgi:NAD(P)-dependent dehydrogenase (short-subunit alcohol dehydrogenase family)
VPLLKPGAVIINTLSVNSYDPGEELLDYASIKGALLIFTKGLAKQMAKRGIRVNGVAPGPIWTPLQVVGASCLAKWASSARTPHSAAPASRPSSPPCLSPCER